jgi:hypothetical protein
MSINNLMALIQAIRTRADFPVIRSHFKSWCPKQRHSGYTVFHVAVTSHYPEPILKQLIRELSGAFPTHIHDLDHAGRPFWMVAQGRRLQEVL